MLPETEKAQMRFYRRTFDKEKASSAAEEAARRNAAGRRQLPHREGAFQKSAKTFTFIEMVKPVFRQTESRRCDGFFECYSSLAKCSDVPPDSATIPSSPSGFRIVDCDFEKFDGSD